MKHIVGWMLASILVAGVGAVAWLYCAGGSGDAPGVADVSDEVLIRLEFVATSV